MQELAKRIVSIRVETEWVLWPVIEAALTVLASLFSCCYVVHRFHPARLFNTLFCLFCAQWGVSCQEKVMYDEIMLYAWELSGPCQRHFKLIFLLFKQCGHDKALFETAGKWIVYEPGRLRAAKIPCFLPSSFVHFGVSTMTSAIKLQPFKLGDVFLMAATEAD